MSSEAIGIIVFLGAMTVWNFGWNIVHIARWADRDERYFWSLPLVVITGLVGVIGLLVLVAQYLAMHLTVTAH